jgi:hypothetical protein
VYTLIEGQYVSWYPDGRPHRSRIAEKANVWGYLRIC